MSEDELNKKKSEDQSVTKNKKEDANQDEKKDETLTKSEDEKVENVAEGEEKDKKLAADEQLEEIQKEQAVGLFRQLEENLKAYGRRPNFERNSDTNNKDW